MSETDHASPPHLICPSGDRQSMGANMTAIIHNITFDCHAPYRLATFWSKVTGYAQDPENPTEPDDPEAYLASPDCSSGLLFIAVPEPKAVKNRVHLDLVPTNRTRDEEVEGC